MLRSVLDACQCWLGPGDESEAEEASVQDQGHAAADVDLEGCSPKVARQESLESANRTVARALFNVAHLFDYGNRRVSELAQNLEEILPGKIIILCAVLYRIIYK